MEKNRKPLFTGVATALITPFSDGKPDYDSLRRITEYQINNGVSALVVCGTTGESPTLTSTEKLRCISAVAETANKRVPIIAGTSSNDTAASVQLSRVACKEGADAVLAVAPYYNKPSANGLCRHFSLIAEATGKPLILYNIPSRTGTDIPFEVYDRLSDNELIAGIKEASGNVSTAASISVRYKERLPLYSGNDDLTLPILSVGGEGVISVISNICPFEMSEMCRLYRGGKTSDALLLYRRLMPLMKALFSETNPIPVKAAMARVGFCRNELRLPLTPARPETSARLDICIKSLGIKISGEA